MALSPRLRRMSASLSTTACRAPPTDGSVISLMGSLGHGRGGIACGATAAARISGGSRERRQQQPWARATPLARRCLDCLPAGPSCCSPSHSRPCRARPPESAAAAPASTPLSWHQTWPLAPPLAAPQRAAAASHRTPRSAGAVMAASAAGLATFPNSLHSITALTGTALLHLIRPRLRQAALQWLSTRHAERKARLPHAGLQVPMCSVAAAAVAAAAATPGAKTCAAALHCLQMDSEYAACGFRSGGAACQALAGTTTPSHRYHVT